MNDLACSTLRRVFPPFDEMVGAYVQAIQDYATVTEGATLLGMDEEQFCHKWVQFHRQSWTWTSSSSSVLPKWEDIIHAAYREAKRKEEL